MSAEFEKMACEKFENLDKFQEDVHDKFEKLDKFQNYVYDKFDEIDERFYEITHILDVIRQSQVLLEEQIMFKIPALFDGYSMHQEKQEILEEKINSINHNVEDHDIRISILEQHSV